MMSLDEFKKILSRFPSLNSLDLTGIGESFCNPDFMEMIRAAKNKGLKVEFNTNGLLMNDKYMDRLIEMGVDGVYFSVDASTKSTYEDIRGGASFDKLIGIISLFSEKIRKSGTNKTQIRMSYTISKDNAAEAKLFPQLAKKAGVNVIFYRDLMVFDSGQYSDGDRVETFDKDFLEQLKNEILEEAKRLNINASLCPSLQFPGEIRKKLCYRPWTTCFIDVFGNLYPCCRITQKNTDIVNFKFANILEDDLDQIWNTDKYKSLRKGITHPSAIPALCKGCECLVK